MSIDCRETRLSNGVRVITAAMPQVQSVSLGIWVGVGGRYESRRMSGASHFIEHLLFKGTSKRSARDISREIEGRGGYFNAFTQEESTCYYARIASRYAWDVLDTLTDMYLHPRFDPVEIDKERGVIVEEIMMYRDQPHQLVQDRLGELMWADHAIGRPLIGTPKNIIRMTRDDIVTYKQRKYVGSNTVVAFAGEVDHDACVRQADRLMRGLSRKPGPKFTGVGRGTGQRAVDVIQKDVEQTHVAMGFRVFGRHDERRYALRLMSVILGENMSSRLFQLVREKHGLAYSIHSSAHLFAETGGLIISAGLDRKRVSKALGLIMGEIVRLKRHLVGRAELRRAKDYAIGQLQIGLESTINQMMWVGENTLHYGEVYQPEEIVRRLERVTPDDIHRLAGRILREGRASIAMVTPDDRDRQTEMIQTHAARLARE